MKLMRIYCVDFIYFFMAIQSNTYFPLRCFLCILCNSSNDDALIPYISFAKTFALLVLPVLWSMPYTGEDVSYPFPEDRE
jgi:hypothetical protein